ncbi:tectonic-3-like [Alosa sapidissima]|uniref:tectonic-3-like n=1 Tax=Alosa sapidissima TaxID=34773 RepID=UPI001C083B08|nr:tectonic-3-like [Alosa sapidissima]
MVHKIMSWIVLSVSALSIISTVAFNDTVNQTDSPSGVNNTNVTEEPTSSTPTQSDFFETTTIEEDLFTDTILPITTNVTDSTPTDRNFTDASTTESVKVTVPTECLCDITPNFCDIGCCCDNLDCEIDDLSSVFNGCEKETRPPGVCIEKWLMFRANVDPDLITETDSLFCVREEAKTTEQQSLPAISEQQDKVFPSFLQQDDTTTDSIIKDFYKVDDMILIQYNRISMLGTLKQPSPGVASTLCVDLNPARFLRSTSHSCSRALNAQSCSNDPRLNVHTYFKDISLLRVPNPQNVDISDLLIPVIPVAIWSQPSEQNGTCLNVVSKVEYIIEFSHAGEITSATLRASFLNSSLDAQILQEFSVTFQLATAGPTPAPLPAMGLIVGNPVTGRFGEEANSLTTLAPAAACSVPLGVRVPIRFTYNSISGCSFRSASQNCSELRLDMYTVLTGMATPDVVAMSSGPKPDWAEVITEDCLESQAEGSCETGCYVPHSLSIQFLWAKRGLLSLPQNYILGGKYKFGCQKVKCPLAYPLAVTSEVTFSEITAYPEPPRGVPQPQWKFPYSFFSRGQEELDGGL